MYEVKDILTRYISIFIIALVVFFLFYYLKLWFARKFKTEYVMVSGFFASLRKVLLRSFHETNTKSKKEFTKRWSLELDYQINRNLQKECWQDKRTPNVRWSVEPFSKTNLGKIDFRGFPLREPLHYQHIQNIDFSFIQVFESVIFSSKGTVISEDEYGVSRGKTGISNSILESCDFISAQLPQNLSGRFYECNFSHASVDTCGLRGTFENCKFTKCNMKKIICRGGKFINCDFTEVNFINAFFYSCTFDLCIFDNAKLPGSNFSGSTFINTKISEKQQSNALFDKTLFK